MADEEKRNNEINSAKQNVKESLALAVKDPSEFRIQNAANALVMADRLVKDPQELKTIRSGIEQKLPKAMQEQFNKKLTQEINNIEKWHDKAEQSKVAPSKPKISQSAKAAAINIGKAALEAIKNPKKALKTAVNKVKAKAGIGM